MNRTTALTITASLAACAAPQATPTPAPSPAPEATEAVAAPREPTLVTIGSPSPLIVLKIMVKAGSAADPKGREGLAHLVANALIEGGFGDPAAPMTKEKLAERVQPWGEGAMPVAMVAGRTTTFSVTVPRDVLDEFLDDVLTPMLSKPLFRADELTRLKNEMRSMISNHRFETLEGLGLAAIDQYVNEGTRFEHPYFGTESSLPALGRADVQAFYEAHYRPGNVIVGISSSDEDVHERVLASVAALPGGAQKAPAVEVGTQEPVEGRRAVVIVEPNAPAAGVHIGFPIAINRTHEDFWPLYVANTWFGVHRDSFGHLYGEIRQDRGYNYGDYAYVEHWRGKPSNLFQVFNQPRARQYFSIWIRPVAHEHAFHITKAATYELARLVQQGLTDEQVVEAKRKAKVLYLNLAETVDRLVAAKVDDAFFGMSDGYLDAYIRRIDAVTPERVNAAIEKHLQVSDLKYVLVTDAAHADELVAQLRSDAIAYGKTLQDYQIEKLEEKSGFVVWKIPEGKLEMLRQDALWANYRLNLLSVEKADVDRIFKTGEFISD